jgi:peptidyl-prolyl cis-trans isomerase D
MYWLRMALLSLLILAFAVWGIPDTFRSTADQTIATVGKTRITPDQFRQSYENELRQVSAQVGRRLTPEQARMFGLEARALSRLVGTTALDMNAADFGLTMSQASIADSIRNDPNFFGIDGKFSKTVFDGFLRQTGLSEAGYLAARRKEEAREQLTETLVSAANVPQLYIDQLHRYREETRVVEFVTVDADKIVKVAEPDEAKLKEYYDANKRQFMTPAYRKLAVLMLTRDAVKAKITVSEDDAKAGYEAEKARYTTPEKRRIQQVAFPDKAAAEKAFAELSTSKNFVESAQKLGFRESDIDLGTLAKKDMIDAKIAEAAFALKKDEVSKPVEGQFTTVILRVAEITPGTSRTFEQVKKEITDRIADQRALAEVQALHDKVDDARAAGKSLKATGEQLGIEFKEYEAIDRGAKARDGKIVFDHPEALRVLDKAFAAAQGVEADAVELADGGYAWFDVLAVTSEAERPFDEIRTEVKTTWLEIEKKKALGEVAAKLVERAIKGESLEAIAKDAGGKVEKTGAITRNTSPTGLTADAVRQAFGLPRASASTAATADGKSRTLFRVAEIKEAAAPTKEQADTIRADLLRRAQSDTLNAYVGALQTRYGVTVNEAAVRQTLGLDEGQRR